MRIPAALLTATAAVAGALSLAPAAGAATTCSVDPGKVAEARVLCPTGKVVTGGGVYVYDSDTSGTSNCTGGCASAWPPLTSTGHDTYAAALSASMFSVITRSDGSKQLAVNGQPLYLWTADQKPGDTTGQNINGFHVVGTDGKKITGG